MKTFEYKHGDRCWWEISFEKKEPRLYNNRGEELTNCDYDYWWGYTVKRDNMIVYIGEMLGQYDCEPTLSEFVEDFLHNICSLAIGFAKYGEQKN